MSRTTRALALTLVLTLGAASPAALRAESKTLARCGRGFLEEVDEIGRAHV